MKRGGFSMAPKYLIVPMKFDTAKWSRLISTIPAKERQEYAELTGYNANTLGSWANLSMRREFPFPSMSAFIKMCNALDVDPREFFCLDLPEHTDGK